jgi:nitroreductase
MEMDLSTVDHLLTTTRSVRKRLDLNRPVEPEIIERCLEIATQAPSGSNTQGWHFVIITDADKRAEVAAYYKKSFEIYAAAQTNQTLVIQAPGRDLEQIQRVRASAHYLADHMHEVPVLILACILGRATDPSPMAQAGFYGSILPAAWSLMLALRARGLGSAWTTLHLRYEKEVATVLGIPDEVTQAALLPVAYFTGDDFKPAKRLPIENFTHWNSWGNRR